MRDADTILSTGGRGRSLPKVKLRVKNQESTNLLAVNCPCSQSCDVIRIRGSEDLNLTATVQIPHVYGSFACDENRDSHHPPVP